MIEVGDCLDLLPLFDADSFDSCVTDPPYHLTTGKKGGAGFMGKAWDGGDIAFQPAMWEHVYRVLKPGAHVVAFGGSRTYHRLACAVEDAGFEIRDQIMWVYGSGFPKSYNLDGDWEGWGTALKPAHEPIVLARKPLIGTVAENVGEWGVGAINIDGCRIGIDPTDEIHAKNPHTQNSQGPGFQQGGNGSAYSVPIGRWPANLIHDGSEEVLAAFPNAPGQIADASSSSSSRETQNVYGAMKRGSGGAEARGDNGSAARFFYCAKASRADRNDGCDDFEPKSDAAHRRTNLDTADRPHLRGLTKRQNNHPTVKPTDLMRYLCRLVTPPGGHVLDPFTGSGSTGRGAVLEGFRFTGIEMMTEYAAIANARIAAAQARVHDEVYA